MTTATVYRMVTEEHLCPFGVKTKDLLNRSGYEVEDHPLRTRDETDQFKSEFNVETTPQVFIDGRRIGGYEDLRAHLGKKIKSSSGTSYQPVIAVFATAFLMAIGLSYAVSPGFSLVASVEYFIAISMCVLAILKLRDLESFTNQFVTYDLVSKRYVPYAYCYPFLEAYAGIGMLAGISAWLVSPFAIFIGSVGAISVIKAVYIDHRDLKCACVGGSSNVPLGFVSLTENLFMIAAGVWMFLR